MHSVFFPRLVIFLVGISGLVMAGPSAVGASGSLSAAPKRMEFGNVRVGGGKTQNATLKNSSTTAVKISAVSLANANFSFSGLAVPLTLTAGASYTFKTTFQPKSSGNKTAILQVVSNAANSPLQISLSGDGTAAGQLSLGSTSLNFGNVTVGNSASLAGTLQATAASVTVSAATLSSAEFLLSGLTLPLTLAAGQSAQFTVQFTPQMSGAASAKISFRSNAADASLSEALKGSGITSAHSVTLNWSASATNVPGYNVYRSQVSGSQYAKLNSGLNQETTFTDGTVQSGQTYYYVTTAVTGQGVESAPSNQVKVTIP